MGIKGDNEYIMFSLYCLVYGKLVRVIIIVIKGKCMNKEILFFKEWCL